MQHMKVEPGSLQEAPLWEDILQCSAKTWCTLFFNLEDLSWPKQQSTPIIYANPSMLSPNWVAVYLG